MNMRAEPKLYTVKVRGHFEYEVCLEAYSPEEAKDVAESMRRHDAMVFDSVEIVAEREIEGVVKNDDERTNS